MRASSLRILSLLLLPLVLALACGDGSGSGSGPDDDEDGDGQSATHARPPAAGATQDPDGVGSVTLAITKLYLGDTNRDGTANQSNGWKSYGYDLDNKISTKDSTDVCRLRNNATTSSVYPDGNDGIDNAFGKNIMPILMGLVSSPSTDASASLSAGEWTLLMDLEALGDGSDYNPLSARIFMGDDLGAAPSLDGNDEWPVDRTSLSDAASIDSVLITEPESYVVGNTWVATPTTPITVPLMFSDIPLTLVISHPIVTMKLDATHQSATQGTIAGVIATDDLSEAFADLARGFDPSFCPDGGGQATLESITMQIEQASDIIADGSQDASRLCDGISIGIGFDASVVKLGAIGPEPTVAHDPCE